MHRNYWYLNRSEFVFYNYKLTTKLSSFFATQENKTTPKTHNKMASNDNAKRERADSRGREAGAG